MAECEEIKKCETVKELKNKINELEKELHACKATKKSKGIQGNPSVSTPVVVPKQYNPKKIKNT